MCAIAGIIGLEADSSTVSKLLNTMRHRGPDGQGVFQNHYAALLHSRLAVIDPERGKQPMRLDWAGEQYWIVYNGELYNTEQLRTELIRGGHSFMGHSDTEVVLHAYAQWGRDCIHKFNGIFAFAVFEEKTNRLFLARDRIGVKPLFYKLHAGGMIFASEMKTILAFPGVKAQLDAEGAAQLILLGPGRLPGSGVFYSILEVKPGYCGYFDGVKLDLCQYWKLTDREHADSFEDTSEQVRELVLDAIRSQMVSDVPLGTFLSGGLDSSLITAVCAGEMARKGKKLPTFSVDYEDNDKYFQASKFQPNSDPYYIRKMVDSCDCDHHWSVLNVQQLLDTLEEATVARDLPGMSDVDFSLLAFCRQIRPHVKVALSGECADEIFGGYPWYRDPEVRSAEGFPWAQNTQQRKNLLNPALRAKLKPEEFVMDAYLQTCSQSDILPENTPLERQMKQMVNLNFAWFMQTLLDRKDRMSMYTSLEVRVPFCDYRIAEYLYAVPWKFKDHNGVEKGLLRYAMRGILPDEILWRKKSPYPKTFHPEYTKRLGERMEKLLADKDAPLFSVVDREALRAICTQDHPWPWYGQLMRTPQTIAYFLQMDFWLRHYQVEFIF